MATSVESERPLRARPPQRPTDARILHKAQRRSSSRSAVGTTGRTGGTMQLSAHDRATLLAEHREIAAIAVCTVLFREDRLCLVSFQRGEIVAFFKHRLMPGAIRSSLVCSCRCQRTVIIASSCISEFSHRVATFLHNLLP